MPLLLFTSDVYLVGLGLTVALVVYPSFHLVGANQWTSYHDSEVRRIGFAVSPAWILQGVGSLWWIVSGPHRGVAFIHAIVALAAVLITLVKAIPAHRRLGRHSDSQDIHLLQRWHWLRTVAWIATALLATTNL